MTFAEPMARVRDAMWDADEAASLASRYRHHPDAGRHTTNAVDREAYLNREVTALLRVMADAAVEPAQWLAIADVDTGDGDGSVLVEEITVRIELEHIQLLTKDKEPRVYLDNEPARPMSCPPAARAKLDAVPDQYPHRPGVKFVLLLIQGDVLAPAIVDVW